MTAPGNPWTAGCTCTDPDDGPTGLDLIPGQPLRVPTGALIPEDPYYDPTRASEEPW